MRFCFGVFVKVLLYFCESHVKKIDFLNALVRSVDKTCELTGNAVTGLLNCTTNLPSGRKNGLGDVIGGARNADHGILTEYFAANIVPLLDNSKRKLAVLALQHIALVDASIPEDAAVDIISGTTKKALLTQSRFMLPAFLAGIFLYATTVDNRIGKDTAKLLSDDFFKRFDAKHSGVTFIKTSVSGDMEPAGRIIRDYFSGLLEEFSVMKTLLYYDQPRPFYSFYVPNDLGYTSFRYKGLPLQNITVERLAGVSRFLIIEGVGGLGKSMMLAHLLLNAIEEYEELRYCPVFIPIRHYAGEPHLVDFIYRQVAEYSDKLTKAMLKDILCQGRCLLLFDGLDELGDEYCGQFGRVFGAFIKKYPKDLYVVSSRPNQSFVSFSRFTVMRILPFDRKQSLELIDRLEYHPKYKKKFRALVEGKLYRTHQSFIENPLLLTIMMLTFEKFADIPSKMYLFFRKTYVALYEGHDATKDGYRRPFRSGLTIDEFAHYFAEFCFQTYNDGKFEFTEEEFVRYYDKLRVNNGKCSASDFASDLCFNMCLLRFEGSKYHFTHRSFQEYFCAVFFAQQKDIFLERLGDYFEKRKNRMYTDQTFDMLHDMIPDKVETYILIPYLQKLFEACDADSGYWTFLEMIHPRISYIIGETDDYPLNKPKSFLFGYVLRVLQPKFTLAEDSIPEEHDFLVDEYGYVEDGGMTELTSIRLIPQQHPWVRELPDVVSSAYEFDAKDIQNTLYYEDIRKALDDDNFIFKSEYNAARAYLREMKSRQQGDDDFFEGLL